MYSVLVFYNKSCQPYIGRCGSVEKLKGKMPALLLAPQVQLSQPRLWLHCDREFVHLDFIVFPFTPESHAYLDLPTYIFVKQLIIISIQKDGSLTFLIKRRIWQKEA